MYCRIILVAIVALLNFGSNAQNTQKFQINVTVNTKITELKLSHYENDRISVVDSAIITNGDIIFSGTVPSPEMYYLEFDETFRLPVFLENTSISIKVDGLSKDSTSIDGSDVHKEWSNIVEEIQEYNAKLEVLREDYFTAKSNEDTLLTKQISGVYDSIEVKKEEHIHQTIIKNPSSYVSPYLVVRYKMYSGDPSELIEYKGSFTDSISDSPYIEVINNRIDKLNFSRLGAIIPNFSMTDSSGTLVSVEEFRGKYVLIDFWASWCGPCRRENPNIVAAYKKFATKGFTVIGISLDDKRDAWLKAVRKDRLTWTQLSDLNGWNNEIAKMFGVRSIPFSILIDPEGKIVAKGLHGEDLHIELNKQLNK